MSIAFLCWIYFPHFQICLAVMSRAIFGDKSYILFLVASINVKSVETKFYRYGLWGQCLKSYKGTKNYISCFSVTFYFII